MPPISYKVLDIIVDAFIEIGACPPGEQPSPDEQQWGFRKFNYLVDIWQALEFFVYSRSFNLYTLSVGLSPHLIGPAALNPTATFSTGEQPRPVRIDSAAQLLQDGTIAVDQPISIRDRMWWASQQTKNIQTNIVTDLYYDPTSPLGSLYFWPVPRQAKQVRLELWNTVSQFDAITDPIGGPGGPGTLPPAYRAALMLTLAETLLPASKRTAHPVLIASALKARMAVFGNNGKSPRISLRDSGIPKAGGSGIRGDFNWLTGGRPGGRPE